MPVICAYPLFQTLSYNNKSFGLVVTYDEKPKRRVYEMLQAQGFPLNQNITFLSDGGDTVRDLQCYLSPYLNIF